jgi:phosphatidylserine/phosphatidylglycerophosphate/cardiolipin synthase-like enzyme
MDAAKEAILFLVFQPGSPSIVDKAAAAANNRKDLFVRGAATDPKAAQVYNTELIHRAGESPVEVVPASAISDQFAFWQHELLKSGPDAHAIIHDKIVVIDPMSDDCVVITGSHNLGYRASYNNDENLLIVRGHKALAQAYAVHVLDIYDHYRFREARHAGLLRA